MVNMTNGHARHRVAVQISSPWSVRLCRSAVSVGHRRTVPYLIEQTAAGIHATCAGLAMIVWVVADEAHTSSGRAFSMWALGFASAVLAYVAGQVAGR